jgi:Yqey-like protein
MKKRTFISTNLSIFVEKAIVDDVTAAMKVAMKAKDSTTLGTIRLIRTAFANTAIELRAESLSDEQVSDSQKFVLNECFIILLNYWYSPKGTNGSTKTGKNEEGIYRHV